MLAEGVHLDPARRAACLSALTLDDWLAVIGHAHAHGLEPALGASLVATPVGNAVPVDIADYLRLLYRTNGDRNRTLRRRVIELVTALNERGVQPLLLKGALTLVADPDCDPAARPVADIDFAVRPERRQAAEETLAALGYHSVDGRQTGHLVGTFRQDGAPAAVRLHHELLDQSYVLSAASVFRRARGFRTDNGAVFLVPDVTDRILHALLEAQIHGVGRYYRWQIVLGEVYEFATIVGAHGPRADWNAIDSLLQHHRLVPVLDSYLVAARDLFGLGWPLGRPPVRSARRHLRYCLLQLYHPDLRSIAEPVGNLRATFAWHRMRAIYGERGGQLSRMGRHAWQCLSRRYVRLF